LLSCDHFIDALADRELALKIRERRPRDLDDALQIALQLEVWAKDSGRQPEGRAVSADEFKKVREFTCLDEQGRDPAEIQDALVEQRKLVEKLLDEFQKSLAELKVSTQVDTPRPAQDSGGVRPWQMQGKAPFYCWGCGQQGHTAKNCLEHGSNVAQNDEYRETSTEVAQQNGNAQAEPASAAPPQHVRPVNAKQMKTCIRVKYRAHKLFALLDTGFDITIAGRNVADRCGWELKDRTAAPIKVATDEQLVIDGVAAVPLRVGGRSTVTDVLVTGDITGLILGVDWMTEQGPLTWDFQNERIRFGNGEWIKLQKELSTRRVRRVCQ